MIVSTSTVTFRSRVVRATGILCNARCSDIYGKIM